MASSLGMSPRVHFTSAKTGEGLEQLFQDVTRDLMENVLRRLYEMQDGTKDEFKLKASVPVNVERKPKNCGDCVIL